MPLTLPNLDDRVFQDLVDEARALIPAYEPAWTNHNPSDPGITLIEMFAWIAETMVYRANRVTAANTNAFLKLLNGPGWVPTPGQSLDDQVRQTVLALRTPQRAISIADFEALSRMADPGVARAYAVARRDLTASPTLDAAGHMSVILIPAADLSIPRPEPTPALLATVAAFLDPRRLITTVVHVVGPAYVPVSVAATIVPLSDAVAGDVSAAVTQALRQLTHPLLGGMAGAGWPPGRGLFTSDVYRLASQTAGVDYVSSLSLTTSDASRIQNGVDGPMGVTVQPSEFAVFDAINLTIQKAG
jgi:hypothetical protein